MGRNVIASISIHASNAIQSICRLFLLITLLVSSPVVLAGQVPATGGYGSVTIGFSGYYPTEAEAMETLQVVGIGCANYSGGLTICWDRFEVVNITPWDVWGEWAWTRIVDTRIPRRHSTDGLNWTTYYQEYRSRLLLIYHCPPDYPQFVENESTWQPGTGWPNCTDGLPTQPPPPPPSTCSGQSGYTINLHGPGGTDGALADVEPDRVVNTLVAHVSCGGQPVGGKAVALNVDAVRFSGGHYHDTGPRPRPNGTVSFNSGNTTDAGGNVSFTFTAPPPSGDHTITANCADGTCGTATGNVWVGVKGLIPIPPIPDLLPQATYQLYESNGEPIGRTDIHPDNHYLTQNAVIKLWNLGFRYSVIEFPNFPLLHINDASLVRGGLFDLNSHWRPVPIGHREHRRGTVVDIRANGGPGSIPVDPVVFAVFEDISQRLGVDASIHGVGTNRHYHVRLFGVPE